MIGLMSACGSSPDTTTEKQRDVLEGKTMTVYHSPSCGCCGKYIDYLRENGIEVNVMETPDVTPVKLDHNMSQHSWSCHTGVIEGYVVEGHVPLKAVAKMIKEQPDIKGITIPGMPRHAPGMGGPNGSRLQILSMNHEGQLDGLYTELLY